MVNMIFVNLTVIRAVFDIYPFTTESPGATVMNMIISDFKSVGSCHSNTFLLTIITGKYNFVTVYYYIRFFSRLVVESLVYF